MLLVLLDKFDLLAGSLLLLIRSSSNDSTLDSMKASCGGLIRDDSGAFLDGFFVNLGSCPITIPKGWGAFYGLELAWNKGFCFI